MAGPDLTDAPIEASDLDARKVAVCHTAGDILDALAVRKDELGLSNAYIEEMATLAAGQVDKMLGPARTRPLNVFKLGDLMEIFALDVVLVHSPAKAERMAGRWEKREARNVRKPLRISKVVVERAAPVVLRDRASLGGMVRAHLLTSKRRIEIARKAARARWRKSRKARRKIGCVAGSASKPTVPRNGRPHRSPTQGSRAPL